MPDESHVPVLLAESVAALDLRGDGVYVDGTFGRGGHSRAILAGLSEGGRLVAIDRDPQAEAAASAIADPRFAFRRARFSEMPQVLDALQAALIGEYDVEHSTLQLEPASHASHEMGAH